jgi:hypothetical protein
MLRWANGFGAVTIDQIAKHWHVTFPVAARRGRLLIKEGLLRRERLPMTTVRPVVLTAKGCKATEDKLAPLSGIRTGELFHDLKLVDVARVLVARFSGKFEAPRRIRSRLGADKSPSRHLPDGILYRANTEPVAIELELTAKSVPRLTTIINEYAANLTYGEVWYLTNDEAVARLVKRLAQGQPHIRVARINALTVQSRNETGGEDVTGSGQ